MNRPSPNARVRIGRNVALVAAAIYAATRAVAYMPGLAPVTGPVGLLSFDGHLLWAWALAWGVAAALCIMDIARRTTRYGLSLVIGITFAWGAGYALDWALLGFDGRGWLTAATYAGPAVIAWGLLFKVTALRDMVNPAGMEENEIPEVNA